MGPPPAALWPRLQILHQIKPPCSGKLSGNIQVISSGFALSLKRHRVLRPIPKQTMEIWFLSLSQEAVWAPHKCHPGAPSPKAALGLIPCRAVQSGEEVSPCSQSCLSSEPAREQRPGGERRVGWGKFPALAKAQS